MDLKEVIKKDCELWEKRNNIMIPMYLGLHEYGDSEETGLYSLEYNGDELYYGTLKEINAAVKTLLKKQEMDNHLYEEE